MARAAPMLTMSEDGQKGPLHSQTSTTFCFLQKHMKREKENVSLRCHILVT